MRGARARGGDRDRARRGSRAASLDALDHPRGCPGALRHAVLRRPRARAHPPPQPDGREVDDAGWFTPRGGARRHTTRASSKLVFPTIKTLETLLRVRERRARSWTPPTIVSSSRSCRGWSAPAGDHRMLLPGEHGYEDAAPDVDSSAVVTSSLPDGRPGAASSASSPPSTRRSTRASSRSPGRSRPTTSRAARRSTSPPVSATRRRPTTHAATRESRCSSPIRPARGSTARSRCSSRGPRRSTTRTSTPTASATWRESWREAPGRRATQHPPKFMRGLFGWYYTRIYVKVRPERVFVWPDGDLSKPPELHDAHLEEVRSGHSRGAGRAARAAGRRAGRPGTRAWTSSASDTRPRCSPGSAPTASRSRSGCRSSSIATRTGSSSAASPPGCRWPRAGPA